MVNTFKISNITVNIDLGRLKIPVVLEDFRFYNVSDTASDVQILCNETCRIFEENFEKAIKLITAGLLSIYENEKSFLVVYHNPSLIKGYELYKDEQKAVLYLMKEDIGKYDTEHIVVDKHTNYHISGSELLMYSIRDAFFFYAQKMGRIAIHSASIIYRDKVWLFSAPSGTGKTTHIEQWENKGYPFDMFNGDVALIYQEDGIFMAGALPWCGTSGRYTNKDRTLGGVLFLKRGEKDHAEYMTFFDSVINLNARSLSPNWTRELMERSLLVIEEAASCAFFAQLSCTPTLRAAEVAKDIIDRYLDETET